MTVPTNAKERLNRILQESIDKRRQVVLTHHSPQGWRTFKSRFVSGSASSQVMVVSAPASCDASLSQFPEPGDGLGVAFRLGHKKCVFGTTLVPTSHSVKHGARQDLVTLRWPDRLQELRRRAYQRTTPPDNVIIPVRLYPAAPPEAGQPSGTRGQAHRIDPDASCHGQLEDLSAGGMRVKVAGASGVQVGHTYRCVLAPRPGKPSLVVDALVRHRQAADQGRASIGFQFVGLEATPEGRRLLQRLARAVTHFQRARPASPR